MEKIKASIKDIIVKQKKLKKQDTNSTIKLYEIVAA